MRVQVAPSRAGLGQPPDPGVRKRLLAAATDLFTRHGYAATSVREIVEQAGVTKPVLYYHFGSKDRIYLEILNDIGRILEEALARLSEGGGTARHRLEHLFLGLFDLFEKNTSAMRFMNAVFWGPPQESPPFDLKKFHSRLSDAVLAIVAPGIAAGELRAGSAEDVTLALIGVLSFSMDLHLAHPGWGLGKTDLARLLDLVFTGIAVPDGPRQEITR